MKYNKINFKSEGVCNTLPLEYDLFFFFITQYLVPLRYDLQVPITMPSTPRNHPNV